MGPATAALQIVTPNEYRGQVSSLYLMALNILGLGCGPTIVGALTTYVFRNDASVGWAMLTGYLLLMPLSLACLAFACRPMREALAAGAR
jgi:MFS family permease